MAISYTALKAECQNDPTGLGLSAPFAAGADGLVAEILNLRRAGISIPRSDITPQEILEAIRVQDLNATTNVVAGSWFESVMQSASMRLLTTAGADTRVLTNIMFLLSNGSGSENRLRALASRTGSRAEQLFGENTVITAGDVATARGI